MTISQWVGRVALVALAMIVCTGSTLRAALVIPIYQKIDCSNGYSEAFAVIVVSSEYGCVLETYGRDCNGVVWHEGVADNGGTWFVNADIRNGDLVGLWGRNGRGEYFVSEFADTH